MSIQPNRVINRIVAQVDQSDWPPLVSRVLSVADGQELIRVYQTSAHPRYSTSLHFWVHALRDELASTGRRADLVGAAGHALCRNQSLEDWRHEFDAFSKSSEERAVDVFELQWLDSARVGARVYRMLESECRRSSVYEDRNVLLAHFWGHGGGASWRRIAHC